MATATQRRPAKQTETVEELARRLVGQHQTSLEDRVRRFSIKLDDAFQAAHGESWVDVRPHSFATDQQRRDWLACKRAAAVWRLVYSIEMGEPPGDEFYALLKERDWSVPQETAAAEPTKEAEHDVAVHPDR